MAVTNQPIPRRGPQPTERALLQGVGVARWAAWVWLAMTTLIQRHDLDHPVVAALLVTVALAWTVGCTAAVRERPDLLMRPAVVVGELVLAWTLLVGDGWVFASGHNFGKGQNLAGSWPLIAVLAGATSLGPWLGAASGLFVASGRYLGSLVNGVRQWPGDRIVSVLTTAVFYAVGAVMWGLVTRRLRTVESEVAMRRARDEVAAKLHDGVLQTLALVERRSAQSDPELAATARASDRELRAWLFHDQPLGSDAPPGLEAQLRLIADRVADAYDANITVSVITDTVTDAGSVDVSAMVAAAGEAITNSAKHADASRVVVFCETDDDGVVFVSVRDNGHGFDVDAPSDRHGVARSIRQRMHDAGGRAEIVSSPDTGTEVRLWSR